MENSSIGSEISTKSARMRAKTLFEMLPKIKEAYTLICSLRCVSQFPRYDVLHQVLF